MAPSAPFLAEIEAQVDAGGGDDLERLSRALRLSAEYLSLADCLVERFVERARQGGRSWAAIGDQLGVSKQAARQRFSVPPSVAAAAAASLRPRLQACLAQAGEEARSDGSDEVSTQHQLLGLLHDGVAATVLERLGVTASDARAASARLFETGRPAGDAVPPGSAEASRSLDQAVFLSRQHGKAQVGTEDLLLVLAADPGSRARRLLNQLEVRLSDVKRELESLLGDSLVAQGRRRRRRPCRCSFCGAPEGGSVRLVAGPGVRICAECARSSSRALEDRDPVD